MLPGLQYFAEQGYTCDTKVDEYLLKTNFKGVCGGNIQDWVCFMFIIKGFC